jgi:hypothetical protein
VEHSRQVPTPCKAQPHGARVRRRLKPSFREGTLMMHRLLQNVQYVGGNRARRVDADTTAPWTHSLPSPFLAKLLLLLGRGKETQKLTKTEQGKYSANRRPKNWQRPSVLSSHYRGIRFIKGVHYL